VLPTITGEFRVGADPDLRFTPAGKAVASIRAVASSRKKDEQTGEWSDDKTTWVTLTVWGKPAENLVESIGKGDLLTVIGKLHVEEWEDNEGNKRITPKILVDSIGPSVQFATAKVHKAERASGGGSAQPADDPWATTSPPASQPDPWASSPATEDPPF
jgi:single-strand DNA-binding protein